MTVTTVTYRNERNIRTLNEVKACLAGTMELEFSIRTRTSATAESRRPCSGSTTARRNRPSGAWCCATSNASAATRYGFDFKRPLNHRTLLPTVDNLLSLD